MNSFRIFIFIFCRKIARTCNIAGAFVFVVFDGKYKKKRRRGNLSKTIRRGEEIMFPVHIQCSCSLLSLSMKV